MMKSSDGARSILGIATLTVCMLFASSTVAFAGEGAEAIDALAVPANSTASPVAEVLDDVATTARNSGDDVALSATADGEVTVDIPSDSSGDVSISSPEGADISISIPFASNTVDGQVDVSGAVSYDNRNESTTVVVPKADGSVQIVSILDGSDAPERFAYDFNLDPGGRLATDETTGAIVVIDGAGNPIALVAPAWAYDANGEAVPTRYEIDGDTLTQVVEHRSLDVAYPVVADPQTLYFWWGQAIKFTKSETKSVASAAASGSPALASVFCGLIASAPGAVVCGIISGLLIISIGQVFQSAAASGKCVQVNMPYVGVIIGGPLTWSFNKVTC